MCSSNKRATEKVGHDTGTQGGGSSEGPNRERAATEMAGSGGGGRYIKPGAAKKAAVAVTGTGSGRPLQLQEAGGG